MSGKVQTTAVRREAPGGSAAWLVWIVAVAFVLYFFGFQTGYSVANPGIQKDVGLTVSQVGLIAATYTW